MPKLPDASDLGGLPTPAAERPVGGYSAEPLAAGGAAIAAGIQQLGTGIERTGAGAGELAVDEKMAENRWDLAKANAALQTSLTTQNAATLRDGNPGPDDSGEPLVNRHAGAVWQAQSSAADLIRDPAMRERFVEQSNPEVQRSIEQARGHAITLQNNADLAYVDQQGNATIDQVVNAPDDATRERLIDAHNQLIDGLVGRNVITAQAGVAAKQQWAHQAGTAALLHLADTNPQAALNLFQAAPGSADDVTSRILQIEGTGKNPRSSAQGVGNFTDATWLDVLKRNRPDLAQGKSDGELLALRADPNLGRQMTAAYQSENAAYLRNQGAPTDPGALYLAHFLGPAGAAAVLKADPNAPVADVLSKAVGPAAAQKMLDANPSILPGKLAGSVRQWADGLMGGQLASSALYQQLRPDVRAELATRAESALNKQQVTARADFGMRVANAESEALQTGAPSQPLSRADFIGAYGADRGPVEYAKYDTNVQTGRAIAGLATMTADQRQATLDSLYPQPGDPNYALKLQGYQLVRDAITGPKGVETLAKNDAAGFAVDRMAASQERYANFAKVLQNPTASAADRANAAQSFARTTLLDQQHFGVPDEQTRVAPKAYIDGLNKTLTGAATAEDPQARTRLIGQIQGEAAMWGQYWPDVMRQLAPNAQPMVRALAAGADTTAMTRLLSLPPDEAKRPAAILQQQNGAKFTDLTSKLNDAFAPFRSTLVGRQLDRDYPGYYHLATELGALYVRDGQDTQAAAAKAFNDLVGSRYDFVDSYRIPKSAGLNPVDVQAGVADVRSRLGSFNIAPAADDLGLGAAANRDDSISKFARDGKWVTTPDNSGLNLVYDGKFVRGTDGAPFALSFPQLANLGSHARSGPPPKDVTTKRENAARHGVESDTR